jgi:tRNA-splicing ligase RtcB
MDIDAFEVAGSGSQWLFATRGPMRVPVVVHGSAALVGAMDESVLTQARNVATLPGIIDAVHVMPDGHQGYGFPIGAVAAFDADEGGVVSAGGVGFDIACGVRCLTTGLRADDLHDRTVALADALMARVPAGVGSTSARAWDDVALAHMLVGGARWAVQNGFGNESDLARIEDGGVAAGADPRFVSARALARQRNEMGTLGSGNHYLEVQRVAVVFDAEAAQALGIAVDDVLVSIHCGSRGLGHQVGTDFLRAMVREAGTYGLTLPDRELACAPIRSPLGQRYLGAMRAAINCAWANRQILTATVREVFSTIVPQARLEMLYDVAHNTCREEVHHVQGTPRRLFVHRKGATRALGPGDPELPAAWKAVGQPVFLGGTMGTASYILVGTSTSRTMAWGSACHGAGRRMSRHEAARTWRSRTVLDELATQGVVVRAHDQRGVAQEAPGAYKDIDAVADATQNAGLARKVARLHPLLCLKG